MLRKIRIVAATICFALITLLFLDFTGTLHLWFGWLARIQFLPAILALNVGVIVLLVALTLLFGRIYCSVICPLGVFQDIVSWIAGKRKKHRFRYSRALSWLRYGMLVIFIAALVAGFASWAALIAPYSAYGRIATNLFAPVYRWGNNLLALLAERMDSYAFYSTEVWLKSLPSLIIAIVTSTLGSGGIWAFLQWWLDRKRRTVRKDELAECQFRLQLDQGLVLRLPFVEAVGGVGGADYAESLPAERDSAVLLPGFVEPARLQGELASVFRHPDEAGQAA